MAGTNSGTSPGGGAGGPASGQINPSPAAQPTSSEKVDLLKAYLEHWRYLDGKNSTLIQFVMPIALGVFGTATLALSTRVCGGAISITGGLLAAINGVAVMCLLVYAICKARETQDHLDSTAEAIDEIGESIGLSSSGLPTCAERPQRKPGTPGH
jgi:hypothetical protein